MASKTVKLPKSKAEVVLRDPETLRVKDRKKIYAAASGQDGIMAQLSLVDGLIAVLIESWTLDLIIPSVKIASLDELEMADYDFLQAEAEAAQAVLFPTLVATTESEADSESPFAKSSD